MQMAYCRTMVQGFVFQMTERKRCLGLDQAKARSHATTLILEVATLVKLPPLRERGAMVQVR
jgi:hypothetical protein